MNTTQQLLNSTYHQRQTDQASTIHSNKNNNSQILIVQQTQQTQQQTQFQDPRLEAGLKKYNQTLVMLEERGKKKHTQIAMDSAQKLQSLRHQRQQFHLEIENKKNIHLSQIYNQFSLWIEHMNKAANIIDVANQKVMSSSNNNNQLQPVRYILFDIPQNNDNNNNQSQQPQQQPQQQQQNRFNKPSNVPSLSNSSVSATNAGFFNIKKEEQQ